MVLTLPQPHAIGSPRCDTCAFASNCGGLDLGSSLFNCFDSRCCGNGKCDEVCPNKSDFFDRLAEVRFLRTNTLKAIVQAERQLPVFVPHLPHQYSRRTPLESEWVSLSPYELLRLPNGRCDIATPDAMTLRRTYKIGANAKIIFRGSDEDKHLEKYWAYRRRDGVAARFKNLDGAIFIGPNFSHFGDVVRTDNIFNRMRQLICLEEMYEAGLNVAPHLNDAAAADWEFWFGYLRANPTISIVAKEFQTRCRKAVEGRLAVSRLADLQERLGRSLHPVIIGGAQYVELIAARFATFTIIDCRPVQDGLHYHRSEPRGRKYHRVPDPRLPHTGPDDLVHDNVHVFEQWIAHRAKIGAGARHVRGRAG